MATGPGVNQGKTAFVEEYLAGHRDADHPAVNEAWRAAGNEGTVSESLVGKARTRLKLTGKGGAKGGADAGSKVKGKVTSSPKRAKGKEATEAVAAPAKANGREGGNGPSRSAFVEEMLGREPKANVTAVNRAWTEAGHEGSISDSVFFKVKRELGVAAGSSADRPASAGASRSELLGADTAPVGHGTAPPSSGRQGPATEMASGGGSGASGDLGRVVDEVEAGIDDLMFTLKVNGGMPEVEAALRAARRLLTRSHGE